MSDEKKEQKIRPRRHVDRSRLDARSHSKAPNPTGTLVRRVKQNRDLHIAPRGKVIVLFAQPSREYTTDHANKFIAALQDELRFLEKEGLSHEVYGDPDKGEILTKEKFFEALRHEEAKLVVFVGHGSTNPNPGIGEFPGPTLRHRWLSPEEIGTADVSPSIKRLRLIGCAQGEPAKKQAWKKSLGLSDSSFKAAKRKDVLTTETLKYFKLSKRENWPTFKQDILDVFFGGKPPKKRKRVK
jgi:hypothetical protein